MKIFPATRKDEGIKEAVEILRMGGLVIYPTDTLYGLGCNALDVPAIKSVFAAKKRPASNPLSITVSDVRMMEKYAEFPGEAEKLTRAFLPGALTLVLKKKNLPDALTGGLQNVGIRIPKSDIAIGIVESLGFPITATSANISGKAPPKEVDDAISQIPEADIAIDAGPLGEGLSSTIVDITGRPKILREGAIKKSEIEKVIGPVD